MQSIRNKSILVVDDDAALLRAIEKVLSSEGCVVTCASWAAEAMEQLADRGKRFDLIITDLRMPFVKGNTILRMIAQWSRAAADPPLPFTGEGAVLHAANAAFPNVPVIIITAFGTPEMKADCFARGAAAFLEKPVDTPRLLAAIESALAPSQKS